MLSSLPKLDVTRLMFDISMSMVRSVLIWDQMVYCKINNVQYELEVCMDIQYDVNVMFFYKVSVQYNVSYEVNAAVSVVVGDTGAAASLFSARFQTARLENY